MNNKEYEVEINLDCSQTENALFSTKTGFIQKVN